MWNKYKSTSLSELKRKGAQSSSKAAESGKMLEPVRIAGRQIANTWWGKAWCTNLEKYADYSNRIGRGKSYVRAGTVIDLEIDRGTTQALVQGSRAKPYRVVIKIDTMLESRYQEVLKGLGSRIENIEALLNGDFPMEMKSFFVEAKCGLFPNPREIHFECSCPDSASMCKHIAAVLFGIGNRLDQNPLLFFDMRGIDVSDFIQRSVEDKLKTMLENADSKSSRIITDQSLDELFGVLEPNNTHLENNM